MKIKRFFSNDMRNVIRMVRDELGPDAVILSNNRVNGGVEVVAAVDYDESIFAQSRATASSTNTSNANANTNNVSTNGFNNTGTGFSESVSQASAHEQPVSQQFPSMASMLREPVKDTLTSKKTSSATQSNRKQTASEKRAGAARSKSLPVEFDELSEQQKQQSDFSFYLLDDVSQVPESGRINDSLYDVSDSGQFPDYLQQNSTNVAGTPPQQDRRKSSVNNSIWSQEPTLVEMRNEIHSLRDLLEKQLTGLAWGDVARSNPLRAKIVRQLLELEISPALAGKISDAVAQRSNMDTKADYEKAWQTALTLFMRELPTLGDDLITQGGVVALVGPTGVGKTTTVAKLAARYALRHGRNNVALVTTDSFRIAAHEQLRTYGRILGMPVGVAANKEELVDILKSFSDKDLVLIDTAGMSHRDMRLIEQFSLINDCAPALKSLLVLSSTTQRVGLDEIVRVFRNVQLDGCVFTKLDETTCLAGALSVAIEHHIPIAYVSNGQKVPEDCHLARPHSLVKQSVLIARKSHQSLENESLELAFSRVMSNA